MVYISVHIASNFGVQTGATAAGRMCFILGRAYGMQEMRFFHPFQSDA